MPQHTLDVSDGDVLLVPGDLHFGIADTRVIQLMLDAADDAGVTHCVLQGDTFECGGLSSHPKTAKQVNDGSLMIEREIEQATTWLDTLLGMVNGKGVAMAGNHENRITRHVDAFPAFMGMEWYDVYAPALEGWECLPDDSSTFVKAGGLTIYHGHQLTGMKMGGGVTPARTVLNHYPGQNTMFGHTHRRDVFTRPTWKDGKKVQHGAFNVGHLQDERHAGWSGHNAWEQSFALVSYFDQGLFDVALAKVYRDRRNRPSVMINGKVYR